MFAGVMRPREQKEKRDAAETTVGAGPCDSMEMRKEDETATRGSSQDLSVEADILAMIASVMRDHGTLQSSSHPNPEAKSEMKSEAKSAAELEGSSELDPERTSEARILAHLVTIHEPVDFINAVAKCGVKDCLVFQDGEGLTMAHYAAAIGSSQKHMEIIHALFEHAGKDAISKKCKVGISPTVVAASCGYVDAVLKTCELLGPQQALEGDIYEVAALSVSSENRQLLRAISDAKGKGFFVTETYVKVSEEGLTDDVERIRCNWLHATIFSGKLDALKYIAEEEGKDALVLKTGQGMNSALSLALHANTDALRYILKFLGAETAREHMLKRVTKDGCPAMFAVARGMLNILDLVFGKDWREPDFITKLVDGNGNTVAHFACLFGNELGMQLVHKFGKEVMFRTPNYLGVYPFEAAVSNSSAPQVLKKLYSLMGKDAMIAQCLQGRTEEILLNIVRNPSLLHMALTLLGHEIFLTKTGAENDSFVWKMAKMGMRDDIRILWRFVGEPLFTSYCCNDDNFVNSAAAVNNIVMVELAHARAGRGIFNNLSKTRQNAAHVAASKGHLDTLISLTSLGLSRLFSEKDLQGRTPINLALAGKHNDVVAFLRKNGLGFTDAYNKTTAKLQSKLASKKSNVNQDTLNLPATVGQEVSRHVTWPLYMHMHV